MGVDDGRASTGPGASGDETTDVADTVAGGRRRHFPVAGEETVLVAVDIAAANAKASASIQSWLRAREQQARLLTYLNSKDAGLRVVDLEVDRLVIGLSTSK